MYKNYKLFRHYFVSIVIITLFVLLSRLGIFELQNVQAANKNIEIGLKQDLYVESGYPSTITYNQRNLFLGYDIPYAKHITRIYFKPNYNQLKNANITPEQIISVKTNFHIYQANSTQLKIRAYKINQPWEQYEVTYNNQPSSSYYTYKNLQPNSSTLQITLTNAFKQDYLRFLENNPIYGFMLRLANEQNPAIRIWSSECLEAVGEHCQSEQDKPTLIVEYKDNTIPQLGDIIGPENNYRTNSSNATFVFKKASDPDNDKLYYRIVVALDPDFSHIIKASSWTEDTELFTNNEVNETATISLHLSDNTWYWRLEVKDIYNNKATSNGYKLVIDTTPPIVPTLEPEPPYTKGKENTVYLNVPNIEDGELFQYQAATFRDFSDAVTSGWVSELQYTWHNLKSTKYYFRVRASDNLGNISNWSNTISSIQDDSKPAIVYFKTNKTVLGRQDKNLTLKARFYDPTLFKTRLTIYNEKGIVIQKYEELESAFIAHTFDVSKLASGTYFAYAQAIDKFSHQVNSKPIKLIIDKTAPKLAVNSIFVNKKYINTNKLQAKITCYDTQLPSTTILYLNNKRLKNNHLNNFPYLFYLKDKQYHLKTICKDTAGNIAYKEYYFIIDTKPPLTPQFKYQLNKEKTQAVVSTKCSNNEILIFNFNKKQYQSNCSKGRAKYTLKNLGPGNLYTIIGYLKDKAGNKSPTSTLSFSIPKPKLPTVHPITINCFVVYDARHYNYTTKYCKYTKNPVYKITGYYAQNKYNYKIAVNIPQNVNLLFKEISCKPRTLWDIRTWFACIPESRIVYSTNATLTFSAFLNGKHIPTSYINRNLLTFTTSSKSALKTQTLELKSLLLKSFIPYTKTPGVLFLKIKNPLVLKQTLHFPYIRKPSNTSKPLSWVFNKPYRITQWFGHTCYNSWHKGIDIGVYKKPILASASGIIKSYGYHKGTHKLSGGYWVAIKHPFGLYTYYWHIDPNATARYKPYVGKLVKTGQIIAISGNTGWYYGRHNPYHLHFEVRTGKYARRYLDPTRYLNVNWNKMPVCNSSCCKTGNDPRRR